VAVSNPTSSRLLMRVLMQIPAGAMPLSGGFYSRSVPLAMEPYQTRTIEYFFYFPEKGDFDHYPVQLARNAAFAAGAEPMSFHVVTELTQVDTRSWAYVSQNGDDDAVLRFLDAHNIGRLDLSRIAFRMKDKDFFRQTLELLRKRHVYDDVLWSYGVLHGDLKAMAEYLPRTVYADQCGMVIRTPLLTLDPVDRLAYAHLEYKPLINARAHTLGKRRKILNDRFFEQYHLLMKKLSYEHDLNPEDLLAVTGYLLLQDRVQEAMDFFKKINPERLETRMQYDYTEAYLGFYSGELTRAREIARSFADHPVPRWRDRFRNILAQLDELEGKAAAAVDEKDRDQRMGTLADTAPVLDFEIEARRIAIAYRHVSRCRINYYPMDIELLFSKSPFLQQDTQQFTLIRPSRSDEIALPDGESRFELALPDAYHHSNLLVEILADGIRKSRTCYAHSLKVNLMENYGQVKVEALDGGKPLPMTYVKVYARLKDGSVQFYKDGYTDLRGRFDYVSLSTDILPQVEAFAVLILSADHGAVVREARAPKS